MPAFNVSLADAIDSIRRIRRLAWRRDATIVAGHDAAAMGHDPEGPRVL